MKIQFLVLLFFFSFISLAHAGEYQAFQVKGEETQFVVIENGTTPLKGYWLEKKKNSTYIDEKILNDKNTLELLPSKELKGQLIIRKKTTPFLATPYTSPLFDTRSYLTGEIGKLKVGVYFDGAKGFYWYSKKPIDIELEFKQENGIVSMIEKDPNGKVTGEFQGLGLQGIGIFGTWSNPAKTKSLPLKLIQKEIQKHGDGVDSISVDDLADNTYPRFFLKDSVVAKKLNDLIKGRVSSEDNQSTYISASDRLDNYIKISEVNEWNGGAHPSKSIKEMTFRLNDGTPVNFSVWMKKDISKDFILLAKSKMKEEYKADGEGEEACYDPEFAAPSSLNEIYIVPDGDGFQYTLDFSGGGCHMMSGVLSFSKEETKKFFEKNAETTKLFGI